MRNNTLAFRGRYSRYVLFFIAFTLILVPFFSATCMAAPGDEVLAAKHAPILYFEKEETCYPVDAMYHIDNSFLKNVDSDEVNEAPSLSELKLITSDAFYLDNQKGTIEDNGIINDYQGRDTTEYPTTVYFKVHYLGDDTVIQYWMFYAFNKGDLNQHEGDWEMVQVVLSNGNPSWVAYSQHHSGQWATWDQVDRDGNLIMVYVARGSHANYLRPFSGKLGIASDTVGNDGKSLASGEYILVDLDDQEWLDYEGRWGEVGEGSVGDAVSSSILGRAGPQGPQFREEGNMWNTPLEWGKSLPQANDQLFLVEMLLYHFVTIFIVITVLILALTGFFIYRRHKKYGLGPRILSMLYIDGINLKSIGNILCIVGIIIAIVGLFNPWYSVSYEFTGSGDLASLDTGGWENAILIDGLDGIQIVVPGTGGPTPVGTFAIPFSLLIGIGIVFLVIASIGISQSRKLGFKYIWRGIRLFTPIILIIVVLMALGSLVPEDMTGDEVQGADVEEIFGDISGSPFGNEQTYNFEYEDEGVVKTAPLNMKWGLGLGGILLLFGGIIVIVAGVLEIFAKTEFFQTKIPVEKPPKEKAKKPKKQKKDKKGKSKAPPAAPVPPAKEASDESFCSECGTKLEKDSEFCPECGNKK